MSSDAAPPTCSACCAREGLERRSRRRFPEAYGDSWRFIEIDGDWLGFIEFVELLEFVEIGRDGLRQMEIG